MSEQELWDRYDEKYKDMSFLEIEKNILAMPDQDPDKEPFYEMFIDSLALNGTNGLLRYQSPSDLSDLRGGRLNDLPGVMKANGLPKQSLPLWMGSIRSASTA